MTKLNHSKLYYIKCLFFYLLTKWIIKGQKNVHLCRAFFILANKNGKFSTYTIKANFSKFIIKIHFNNNHRLRKFSIFFLFIFVLNQIKNYWNSQLTSFFDILKEHFFCPIRYVNLIRTNHHENRKPRSFEKMAN